ncbi:hypothetical protein [Chryseobacterium oryctis]|uniref:Lipoprotein n=1 Tax=Chryseobacterium oryctis TaxID=2952618 RepID=A0ABT3HKN9_9FLAO|nr:hypothetical protein [Chryseobacterium oryctis]MCW3160357.1 hypothetical protein [Chryseobacterium oryctis]
MKKNLVLRLLLMTAFAFMLHSCVHDEIYTSSEPKSKEYHSKSLWKEDEKYIENVMKVFEKYGDENYFTANFGNIYWDYAITMGTKETFLEAPVIKNGKVNFILVVEKEGDRVFFRRKDNEESKKFFNALVFNDRSRYKIAATDGMANTSPTNKGCLTTVITWTWTNEDGSAGPTYTYYETHCTGPALDCQSIYESGSCGGSTGGGGTGSGGGSGGGNGGYPYTPVQNPCEKAKNNNVKAKELLSNTKIAVAESQLTSTLSSDTNEKSFSFGKDANGNYETTPIKTATAGNQVGLQADNPNLIIEGGAHTHTKDLFNCFSAGDIYSLQGANTINPSFNIFFVFANGGVVYALTVTDPIKYADFVANHSAGNNLDMATSYWKETSPIYIDMENARKQFQNQGLSEDDAMANATALVLNKYEIGASLSQKDSSGNFKSIFVNENITNINVGGISVPINTYSQTTDCNLKP